MERAGKFNFFQNRLGEVWKGLFHELDLLGRFFLSLNLFFFHLSPSAESLEQARIGIETEGGVGGVHFFSIQPLPPSPLKKSEKKNLVWKN